MRGIYTHLLECTGTAPMLAKSWSWKQEPLTMPLVVVVTQPQVSAMLQPLATTAEVSAQLHQASLSAAATCLHSVKNITYTCPVDIHTAKYNQQKTWHLFN